MFLDEVFWYSADHAYGESHCQLSTESALIRMSGALVQVVHGQKQ